jgi:hypothetical protein
VVSLPLIVSGHTSVRLPTSEAPEVEVFEHVVDWNASAYDIRLLDGVDLVATSDAVRGRFESDPLRFSEQARFYGFLDGLCQRVATFESGFGVDGPKITVYRVRPAAREAIEAAGALDSLWWTRTIPRDYRVEAERLMHASGSLSDLTPGLPLWVQPLRNAYAERYRFSVNDLTDNLLSLNRLAPAERLGVAALTILPEDLWALESYMRVAAGIGEWDALERRLTRSIAMLSSRGSVPPHIEFARAEALNRLGRATEARRALQALVRSGDPSIVGAARERLRQIEVKGD